MATLNMDHVESECPICHENYIEPKILPCAHLLCRNCLVSWIKTSTEAHCPLCRSAIFDLKDSNSRSLEYLAECLPTDHAMSAVVESYKIISQRQVCCVHTNTDAVSLCLQCSVMLCQSCVEHHHILPITSSHKTENLATLTSERLAVFRQSPCFAHPTETPKLFCSNHGVSICHLCASSKHRSCQEVTDLNEILEKHKQSLAKMEDNLTEAESALNEILAKVENLVVKSEEDAKDAYIKIDSMCDDLIVSVESCRNKLKKILKDSEEDFKAAVEDRKSYLSRRIGLVSSHKLLLKRVQQTASSSVMVAMATMFQNRFKDLTSAVSLPLDMKPMKIAKLNIDEEAPSRVKSELEKLSHMTVISTIRNSFLQNAWMFHDNCGSNIRLNINRHTAKVIKKSDGSNRMVMSNEPMSTNNLYEIKVNKIDSRYDGSYTAIGVCEECALSVPLPQHFYEIKTFVGVQASAGIRQCQSTKEYSCPALATVKVGSRLGVMIDTSHYLHVYVDGKDQGVMAKNVARPCYAVFDLFYFLNKFAMATLNMDHVETECPICHENYIEPKILPCAHLLCRNCLVSWVKTTKEAHCPLCRSAIYDLKDSNSKTSEDLAECLPTDHAMSAIVESYKIISQRQVCCVHTNTDAVSLCLHCSIMLCQSCVEYHHTLPISSSHKTQNLSTLTSERLAVFRQSPCSAHPNKTSELFCSTHGVSICHLCASSKHRACREVTDLNEISEKRKQSFAEMEDNLTKAESDLNETLAKFEDFVVWSDEDTKSAYTKIDSMCDDLIISVESCRNKLKKILKDSEEGLKTAVEDRKSYLAQRIGLVTSHKLLLKRVQQTASSSVQVAMATMIQNRVKKLTSAVSLPLDMKPMEIAKLNIDEKATSRVKSELEKISNMIVISPMRKSFLQKAWMFHDNCGSNITLNSNRQTAEVKDTIDHLNRLVISNGPMSSNNLYEIKVEEIDPQYNGGYTVIGVCEESALSVPLPRHYYKMKTFVGVRASHVFRHCQETGQFSCPALAKVKVESRIGVMVDTSHSLHVYVDGKDQGVMAKNVAQPCYAVFDLLYYLKKVTTLPVSSPQ